MTDPTKELIERAARGDDSAIGELFELHRSRLARIIQFRLDSRVRSRIDAADAVQETFMEATGRFPEYLQQCKDWPFFVWLRYLAMQKLVQIHRRHLDVKGRTATRDVSIFARSPVAATSVMLANRLVKPQTSPSMAAQRAERKQQVERALDSLEPIDREVIALRHFEHLGNSEVATVLEISTTAANNRYVRALQRLKQIMDGLNQSF